MSAAAQTPTPPHEAFASRLKSARLRSGKSQEQIAGEVGTSRRHWIRWEGGWHIPSPLFVSRIAEATDQTVDYLNGSPTVASADKPSDDGEEADVLAALFQKVLDARDKRLEARLSALLSEAAA